MTLENARKVAEVIQYVKIWPPFCQSPNRHSLESSCNLFSLLLLDAFWKVSGPNFTFEESRRLPPVIKEPFATAFSFNIESCRKALTPWFILMQKQNLKRKEKTYKLLVVRYSIYLDINILLKSFLTLLTLTKKAPFLFKASLAFTDGGQKIKKGRKIQHITFTTIIALLHTFICLKAFIISWQVQSIVSSWMTLENARKSKVYQSSKCLFSYLKRCLKLSSYRLSILKMIDLISF